MKMLITHTYIFFDTHMPLLYSYGQATARRKGMTRIFSPIDEFSIGDPPLISPSPAPYPHSPFFRPLKLVNNAAVSVSQQSINKEKQKRRKRQWIKLLLLLILHLNDRKGDASLLDQSLQSILDQSRH